MTSSDTSAIGDGTRSGLGESLRVGWRLFVAESPPRVLFWVTGVRGVMQAVFFVLLGRSLVTGAEGTAALIGAVTILMTGPNVIGVANVPIADKDFGTAWRLRRTVQPLPLILAARALPYPAMACLLIIPQTLVAGVVLGVPERLIGLVPLLPLFALMAFTTAVLGLTSATLSVAKRADVLAPNLVSYAILLSSGAVVPSGRFPWLDLVGTFLPARNALLAINARMAGQPWVTDALSEVAVGALWAGVGVLGVALQSVRARRTGRDDFA